MLAIDHVLIAVRDLAAAADRLFADHGLASVPGGEHAGLGTANRIVPLGDSYLELIAVADPSVASMNPLGQRVAESDGFIGWVVRTDDIDAEAERLRLVVLSGARLRPDGSTLSWRMAGIEVSLTEPSIPFFIQWGDDAQHPSRADAPHRVRARGIASVEVGGSAGRLAGWLGDDRLPMRTVEDGDGVVAVTIATDDGEIVLR